MDMTLKRIKAGLGLPPLEEKPVRDMIQDDKERKFTINGTFGINLLYPVSSIFTYI